MGNAQDFDGTDDYITMADSDSLDIDEAITIEVLFQSDEDRACTFVSKWLSSNKCKSADFFEAKRTAFSYGTISSYNP